MYILNTTFSLKLAWKVIEGFMAVHMKNKMVMTGENTAPDLLNSFHPSQLEEKYGGKAKNATKFWPPIMPSKEYGCAAENLMSEEEYLEEIQDNPELRVRPDLISKVKKQLVDSPTKIHEITSKEFIEVENNSSAGMGLFSEYSNRRVTEIFDNLEESVTMDNSEYQLSFDQSEMNQVSPVPVSPSFALS